MPAYRNSWLDGDAEHSLVLAILKGRGGVPGRLHQAIVAKRLAYSREAHQKVKTWDIHLLLAFAYINVRIGAPVWQWGAGYGRMQELM